MNTLEFNIKRIQSIVKAGFFVSRKSKQGYTTLLRDKNKELFSLLAEIGFFSFHISNSGWIISLHQIVNYVEYGYKAWSKGYTAHKDDMEIHHLDADPTNNHPDNLVYLSRQDHLLVSDSTRTGFYGNLDNHKPTPFNKQGRTIKDHKHFLINVIKASLEAMANRIGQPIKVNLTSILMRLSTQLYKQITKTLSIPSVDVWLTNNKEALEYTHSY